MSARKQGSRFFKNGALKHTSISIVIVTPDMAKDFLSKNKGNRPLNAKIINRYAQDMIQGRWILNSGEPLKFYKCGKLGDGQHRLAAVILSGVTLPFLVYNELDENAFSVIDSGKTRSASDVLAISGVRDYHLVSAIISKVNFLNLNVYSMRTGKEYRLTNLQIKQVYEEKPLYWDELAIKAREINNQSQKILEAALIGAFIVYFSNINKDSADEFFNNFAGISKTEVIEKLKEVLYKDKYSHKKITTRHKVALILKCWNYFRSGKNPSKLRFLPDIEAYPEAI